MTSQYRSLRLLMTPAALSLESNMRVISSRKNAL